jgi:hypothetical protein
MAWRKLFLALALLPTTFGPVVAALSPDEDAPRCEASEESRDADSSDEKESRAEIGEGDEFLTRCHRFVFTTSSEYHDFEHVARLPEPPFLKLPIPPDSLLA